MSGQTPLTALKGVGEKRAANFLKLSITTVEELMACYPRTYDHFLPPVSIEEASACTFGAVCGTVMKQVAVRSFGTKNMTAAEIGDGQGGKMRLTWFNMPYLRNTLKPGMRFVFRGRIRLQGKTAVMEQPQIFTLGAYEEKQGTFQPVYSLAAGIKNSTVSRTMAQAFEQFPDLLLTMLPQEIQKKYTSMPYGQALYQIHFPSDERELIAAHRRLAFEEFFRFIYQIRLLRSSVSQEENQCRISRRAETEDLMNSLPFRLTGAQKRTLEEIREGLAGPYVMSRMIQGDVGSGKTIVAFLALYETALAGYQGVMMAPTEVLARQHYQSLNRLFSEQGISLQTELLTGSMKKKEKREAYERIAAGISSIIIGTHALIQEAVQYFRLALVITDEQHRFGVKQRRALSEKGYLPHVLVMSATPIPRTLAMILYGDLELSVMDELPADRLPIKNCVVNIRYREKAYQFIQNEVEKGHQAYVVCPMVEASELMDGENVVDYARQLRQVLPASVRVEYLHGKMKEEQKDALMQAFSQNEIQVLVSTTVIEVGIDVPNATVMMIENAERFGLASLHQLRGRVGRGNAQSYCILVNCSGNEEAQKRLEILNQSNDGFFIASEDLKLRGPGELFGVRQSGLLSFRIGDVYQDADLLQLASEAVEEYLATSSPEEQGEFSGGLTGESVLGIMS